jgi:hypothetical protein
VSLLNFALERKGQGLALFIRNYLLAERRTDIVIGCRQRNALTCLIPITAPTSNEVKLYIAISPDEYSGHNPSG